MAGRWVTDQLDDGPVSFTVKSAGNEVSIEHPKNGNQTLADPETKLSQISVFVVSFLLAVFTVDQYVIHR